MLPKELAIGYANALASELDCSAVYALGLITSVQYETAQWAPDGDLSEIPRDQVALMFCGLVGTADFDILRARLNHLGFIGVIKESCGHMWVHRWLEDWAGEATLRLLSRRLLRRQRASVEDIRAALRKTKPWLT